MKTESKNCKISIGLLIALVVLPQISETIYTPALPNVATGLKATAQMVEATLAIYFLGFAVGVSIWGAISDWSGRRIAMLSGLLIYAIGTIACGNSQNIESLLVWRFIQAFGVSVGSVITQTILRETYDGQERSKLFLIISGALAFSPALGPLLGGFFSELFGWRSNFWFLAGLGLLLIFVSYLLLKETRPKHVERPCIKQIACLFVDMMSSQMLWGHIILIGATNGIIFSFYQEAPFIFIEQLGMSPSHYGFIGLLIAASTLVAARFSYLKSKKYSPLTIIRWGAINVLIGGIVLEMTIFLGFFKLDSIGFEVALSALFLIFFGVGLIIPNSLSQALKSYQSSGGTAGSIFGGAYYCIIAICTLLMSFLHDGTPFPLAIFIVLLGASLIVGWGMIRFSVLSSDNTLLPKFNE
ncbi:MAG: multidrug effflux MFS transporter [Parachlamydiaceae bacterium]|nr:multidrug effflux MFS transporter [Parachlamydiaceae bacterium]